MCACLDSPDSRLDSSSNDRVFFQLLVVIYGLFDAFGWSKCTKLMGNKQASQQKPVKKSPHSESLSRLYEVHNCTGFHLFFFILSCYSAAAALRLYVNVFIVSLCIRQVIFLVSLWNECLPPIEQFCFHFHDLNQTCLYNWNLWLGTRLLRRWWRGGVGWGGGWDHGTIEAAEKDTCSLSGSLYNNFYEWSFFLPHHTPV